MQTLKIHLTFPRICRRRRELEKLEDEILFLRLWKSFLIKNAINKNEEIENFYKHSLVVERKVPAKLSRLNT